MSRSIGVIGLGMMGDPMARHFLEAGHDVVVFDVRDEPADRLAAEGATKAGSPAEVAGATDVTFVVVLTEQQADAVILGEDGIASGAGPGHVTVVSSSVSPEFCVDIEGSLPEDVHLLDAPLCRGADAAHEGELLVLVGGDRAVVESIQEVFGPIASPEGVHYMGELGLGQVAKAANNAILWAGLVADVEVFELCRTYGMDVDVLTDALKEGSGTNWGVETWTERYPRHLPTADKDMKTVLEMAEQRGVTMPLSGLVHQLVTQLREEWKQYE